MTWEDKLSNLAELLGMRVAVTGEGGWTSGLHCGLLIKASATNTVTAHKPCRLQCHGKPDRTGVAISLGPKLPHIICTHLIMATKRCGSLSCSSEATKAGGADCLEAEPIMMLGDFNALRRADYSDAQWEALVSQPRPTGQVRPHASPRTKIELGGWGWSDCRDVALRDGGTVTGELATSVYGARVDAGPRPPAAIDRRGRSAWTWHGCTRECVHGSCSSRAPYAGSRCRILTQ